tara:strand:+ start:209 stop:1273 length:1065 start_codon:yes stop_codon:yes gene_type:complete
MIKPFKELNKTEKLILNEVNNNSNILDFINKYFELKSNKTLIIPSKVNDINHSRNKFNKILSLKKINNIRYINKYFEEINIKLNKNGMFFGFIETQANRKKYLLNKYPFLLNYFIYLFDLVLNRILPRLTFLKKLYFFITKGKNKVLSKAETLGRLYSCGFEIVEELNLKSQYFFIVKKTKKPNYDSKPTYGPIISLNRIGKNKKKFKVYKLRTMHPYSEYIQEYIYSINNLEKGGKIKNDFRISSEGKFLRKYWIDELPMLINVLKGDMKLVGVRPLSLHYFSLYNKELQDLRTQFKPGFIPPFYVDLPKSMDEIMESEMRYLNLCKNSEFKTDLKYFFLAFKNVLFKHVRSN